MYFLFILLLIVHFIVDFYIQSGDMVSDKKYKNAWKKNFITAHLTHMLMHAIAFGLAITAFFWLTKFGPLFLGWHILCFSLAYGIVHAIIDVTKEFLNDKKSKAEFLWFVLDQMLHVIIAFIAMYLLKKITGVTIPKEIIIHIKLVVQSTLLILGIVILLKPTSVFVINFLNLAMCDGKMSHIKLTKSHLAKAIDEETEDKLKQLFKNDNANVSTLAADIEKHAVNVNRVIKALLKDKNKLHFDVTNLFDTNNAGKWIGYLERIMIFVFYLIGQFTAIAAVMAIKTAFRFNDLKDDNDSQRSEYIMLGTFASLFVTIIIAVLTKHFMHIESFSALITAFKNLMK